MTPADASDPDFVAVRITPRQMRRWVRRSRRARPLCSTRRPRRRVRADWLPMALAAGLAAALWC